MSDGMTGASGGGDEDKSFAEFHDYFDVHAKNGVILNGILTWIDIQQKTTAPFVWRNQAMAWFSEPEVMEAKEALWNVCGNKVDIIGKIINRTSNDKKNVTIGDIGDAMVKLRGKGVMPLCPASSLMMQRVPCYNTTCKDDTDVTNVVTRVKALEESMNEYMKQQTSQMNTLVETVKKIEPTPAPIPQPGPGHDGANFMQQQRARVESLSKKHRLDDDSPVFHPSGSSSQSFQPSNHHTRRNAVHQPSGSLSQPAQPFVQPSGIPTFQPQTSVHPAGRNATYAEAMAARTQGNNFQPSGQNQPPFRPRKQSNLLYGKARMGKDNQTQLLAANVNLVASGVSKAATDQQLKGFLEDKGIKVTEIECLTYHPDARTNTFRVAIAIEDYEKALNPDVWPYRVAVRTFRPARRDREQRSMEAQFGRTGGVVHNQPQQPRPPQQQQQQQQQQQNAQQTQSAQQPSSPVVIEVSNKFDVLADMDDLEN